VIHGDIFDLVVQNARWLAHLGDKAYDFAIRMNRLRQLLSALVRRVLLVAVAMGETEGQERRELYRASNRRSRRGAGVMARMGDLRPHPLRHHPRRARYQLYELRRLGGKLHALAEHEDGRFEILTWTDPLRRVAPVAPAAARAA